MYVFKLNKVGVKEVKILFWKGKDNLCLKYGIYFIWFFYSNSY